MKIEEVSDSSGSDTNNATSSNTRTRTRTKNKTKTSGKRRSKFNKKVDIDFSYFERPDPSTIKITEAEKVLKKIKKLATAMDNFTFNPFPIPIGLDAIIGFIPWVGDFLTTIISLYQVFLAFYGLGIPYSLLGRMLFYVLADFFVGIIPFIGDLLDTALQANLMNYDLAEEWYKANTHLFSVG